MASGPTRRSVRRDPGPRKGPGSLLHGAPGRPDGGPPAFALALALLAGTVALLAAIEIGLLLALPAGPRWVLVLFPATGLIYLLTGAVAWSRRPSNHLGVVMIAGALAWIGAGLLNVAVPAMAGVGLVLAELPLAVVLHLLLAFPSGRLRSTADRVVVAAIYVAVLVLEAPSWLFGQGPAGPCPALALADRPDLADLGRWVQQGTAWVLAAATIVLLARRLREATPRQRRVLGPLYLYGMVVWIFVPLSARIVPEVWDPIAMAVGQIIVLAGVPLVFALAVRRGGFGRMGGLDELSAWLAARSGGPDGLASALAGALGDPSLRLVLATPGGHLDLPVASPVARPGVVDVALAGRRVGAILYDTTLIADPAVVRGAARSVAVALDHERLTVELRASRDHLAGSRARIARAADDERRRIARDLHDGLQGRLVLLGMEAGMLSADPALPATGREQLDALREGVEAAVRELRDLVHGVLPAGLIERGLPAALEDLTDRLPLPTALDIGAAGGACAPAVELTAYFVAAESLANALKHARATRLHVTLRRRDGVLRLEVRDDGLGGAQPAAGSGLRGLADRVEVLGGELTIDSPPGGGTRVVAELPDEAAAGAAEPPVLEGAS